MRQLSEDDAQIIRTIVKEEIQQEAGGLKYEVEGLKQRVGGIEQEIGSLNGAVGGIKLQLNTIEQGQKDQGILFEQLQGEFKTVGEAISNNLQVKSRVDDHEARLNDVESSQQLITKTVAAHSKQLNVHP